MNIGFVVIWHILYETRAAVHLFSQDANNDRLLKLLLEKGNSRVRSQNLNRRYCARSRCHLVERECSREESLEEEGTKGGFFR